MERLAHWALAGATLLLLGTEPLAVAGISGVKRVDKQADAGLTRLIVLTPRPNQEQTTPDVLVLGRVEPPTPGTVRAGTREAPVLPSGRFSLRVELPPGSTTLEVELVPASGTAPPKQLIPLKRAAPVELTDQQLLAKYDVDADGQLSRTEARRAWEEIKQSDLDKREQKKLATRLLRFFKRSERTKRTKQTPEAAFSGPTQVVRINSYELTMPSNLKENKRLAGTAATLQYGDSTQELYVIVVDDDKAKVRSQGVQLTTRQYMDSTLAQLRQTIRNLVASPVKATRSAGLRRLETRVTGVMKNNDIAVAYRILIAESATHYYKVIAWTKQSSLPKYGGDLHAIVSSLRERAR